MSFKLRVLPKTLLSAFTVEKIIHCNKGKISYTFAPKEMCRKHYIIEQISGSLHEIRLYNIRLDCMHT